MTVLKAKLAKYRCKLEEKKNQLAQSIRVLEQEGRQDEANLEKVRFNIVNVYAAVASADENAVSACQDDAWEQFCKRYSQRFRTLSQPWRNRLAQARLHQDTETIAVEEAKLETAEWLEKVFVSLEEE